MNRKIRALIVDDELLAQKRLRTLLNDDPEIEVIAECRNGREAVRMIREQSPDIVFLDIQMPEMDGFQVIEEVGARRMPVTVFVTAFDNYALRAFDAHALDYLLKPFDPDRFDTALNRAKTLVRQQTISEISDNLSTLMHDLKLKTGEAATETNNIKPESETHQEPIDRVVIKSGGRIYFLKIEEIDWVEGAGNYLSLHRSSQTHLIRETMDNFHAELDSQKFLRIHRSAIVNIERIKDIQLLFKREYVITLTNGKQLKSSRSYRHEIQALLDKPLIRAKKQIKRELPVDFDSRLLHLLDEIKGKPEYLKWIIVKTADYRNLVPTEDIDWIGAAGNYLELHVGMNIHLVRERLGQLEQKLDPDKFIRIHRSTIVALDRIKKLSPMFNGDHLVFLKDGTELNMSRTYYEKLFARLSK